MSLIQRALDRPMSQGSPEFFLDLFGQFLASLAIPKRFLKHVAKIGSSKFYVAKSLTTSEIMKAGVLSRAVTQAFALWRVPHIMAPPSTPTSILT